MITLKVNGETKELDVRPEMPLLWALRDRLNLTGTKFGCGHATIVFPDNVAVPAERKLNGGGAAI